LLSVSLRSGVDVQALVKQLRGIRCPSIAWENGKSVLSCADAIGSILERHISGEVDVAESEDVEVKPAPAPKSNPVIDYGLARNIAGQCPDCGGLLAYEEGCYKCQLCGYTKC
jgi:ribonucleoside-diphosphate reductase alpha chain